MRKRTARRRGERARERARGYTLRQRLLNLAGIATFFVLAVWTTWRIVRVAEASAIASWGWLAAAAIFLALPCADLFSGLVHWAADNWGSVKWPVLGGFIQPFRNHHHDPLEMTRHGFVERNGDPCIVALPTFWWATLVDGSGPWVLFGNAFWLGTAGWVLVTNQVHAWAHMPQVPRLVRLLQRMRLILSPEHHAAHHRAPYAKNYCITNGWMDGPMRWLRVWVVLEWILTKMTGVKPLHARISEQQQQSVEPSGSAII